MLAGGPVKLTERRGVGLASSPGVVFGLFAGPASVSGDVGGSFMKSLFLAEEVGVEIAGGARGI
jgi:hypothetical protein